jgi:hypothetical protein
MNILSRYQFKSELFAGKFSGFNEVLPPGGTDSSTGKTLVKVRFDDEQTLDFASQINGSQLALAQIDNLIGGGDAKRSSLGNHPKAAIDNHFKTGHREPA